MARLQQKGWPRKNRMEEHRGLQVFMGSAFALSQESWHFFFKKYTMVKRFSILRVMWSVLKLLNLQSLACK